MNYYILLSYNFRVVDNPIFCQIESDVKTVTAFFIFPCNDLKRKCDYMLEACHELLVRFDEIGIFTYVWYDSIAVLKEKIIEYEGVFSKYRILEDQVRLLYDPIEREYKLCHPFLNYHKKNSQVRLVDSEKFFDNVYFSQYLPFFEMAKNVFGMQIQNRNLHFLNALLDSDLILEYDKKRDFLDAQYTTSLSVLINSGQLSVRTVFVEVVKRYGNEHPGVKKFLNELGWRDFAYHQRQFYPTMLYENINKKIIINYTNNSVFFTAWREGRTGYSLIDAAMQQLNSIGWIPNRMRMVVASFLTKNLLVSWQLGAQYFLEKLIDADEVINAFNWQWIAGLGMDRVPYFRIFNPDLQAKKYDPDEVYQKKWLLHKTICRIVDLKESREKAMQAIINK